jgi:ethanolamine utilization protein EutN
MGDVIGKVVMTVKDPSLEGARFLVVQPFNHDGTLPGKPLVAIDVVQAGPGDRVYLVKGREASMPWLNPNCPVDACIVGIIDQFHVPPGGER